MQPCLVGLLIAVPALAQDAAPRDEAAESRVGRCRLDQVGANVRYALSYDRAGPKAPATVVCKFSSRDEASAAAGVAALTYETEVAFYRDLAHTVDISRPHCHFAEVRPGTADVVLVMEDIAPAEQGDQIAGCTVQQASLAVEEAARLHGPRWGDPTLEEFTWLDRGDTSAGIAAMLGAIWDGFVERYRATLDPVTLEAGPAVAALAPELLASGSSPRTPVHSDYRLDNMLFAASARGPATDRGRLADRAAGRRSQRRRLLPRQRVRARAPPFV